MTILGMPATALGLSFQASHAPRPLKACHASALMHTYPVHMQVLGTEVYFLCRFVEISPTI